MPTHESKDDNAPARYQQKLDAIRSMLEQIGVKPIERLSKRQELAMYARKVLKAEIVDIDLVMQIVTERHKKCRPHLHLYSAHSKRRLRLCLRLIDLLSNADL